jgi:4-diphosphocytidyl-2-C-methyl-D-erythritol kinase
VNIRRDGDAVRVLAPAKINLFLELHGRRPDGFHDIETVMQTVALYDEIVLRLRPEPGVTLRCSDPSLPDGPENLAYRAAEWLLRERDRQGGVAIGLTKRIPAGAGLGGGSSDAAGVLVGLNELFELGLGKDELGGCAARLGSDIAFFVWGGTALCTGRGEIVRPVPSRLDAFAVISCPPVAISTAEAYRRAGIMGLTAGDRDASLMLASCAQGRLAPVWAAQFNRFEPVAFACAAAVKGAKDTLSRAAGAPALVSGSGAAVYALVETQEIADRAADALRARAAGDVFVARTVR